MVDVSVIIPARNERFLTKTIKDVVAKSRINTEVIAVLEGYWPDEIVRDPAVHYIHFSKPRGMRGALNAGVAIARGKFVMKLDGHCMMAEGFDEVLAEICRDNWVCIPTRHRLDPEAWEINNGNRPPINYQFINLANDNMDGKEWRAKNRDKSLEAVRVDDIIAAQGSMYFLPRALWYELGLLDIANYGSFRKDPQEVMFKCWTSGGRCVRVKDTWYAHLYKGKRYGRGYSTSKGDWAKGDTYVKKWWTDSAWDKQQIPLCEIFARFPDMPGWEEHPWMKDQPDLTHKLPNLYQVLEVNGKPFSRPRPDKKASRFWNEGKWETFVEPLLPDDCTNQTFVEMGCEAGLFLKLAKDKGFERVIGIEKNKTPVVEGQRFRDTIGYDYELLKCTLGGKFGESGNFDIDEMPIADVTLLSTFHYYVDINAWIRYVDRLKTKSCYVLIVSRPELKEDRWRAKASLAAAREYFHDWEEVGLIENVPTEGDSKPRNLYSIMFKNPLISRVAMNQFNPRKIRGYHMHEAQADLAQYLVIDAQFDLFDTDYYRAWTRRKSDKWSERTIRYVAQLKTNVMQDVRDNGLKDPLLVDSGMQLCDGGHRLAILKAMGHRSVIVRVI